jgi:hypothetical protein
MTRRELLKRWEARREEFRRLRVHVDGALMIDEFLSDLEAEEHQAGDQELSLSQAAEMSGYSTEHLARLIRAGRIRNCGRKNKPLIRLADLPHKPTKSLASCVTASYDAAADARALLSRRGER